MFGVGNHFSIRRSARGAPHRVAGRHWPGCRRHRAGLRRHPPLGLEAGAGLVFGLALSVASTVVLLASLEARNALTSEPGRVAVGWLVVEDLIMVVVLVLLPALAGALESNAAAASAERSA